MIAGLEILEYNGRYSTQIRGQSGTALALNQRLVSIILILLPFSAKVDNEDRETIDCPYMMSVMSTCGIPMDYR